jgi:hypothetical protein
MLLVSRADLSSDDLQSLLEEPTMRRINPAIVVALLIGVGFAVVSATGQDAGETTPATLWEYRTADGQINEKGLNELGNDGWEMCGVQVRPMKSEHTYATLYFKRQR